MSSRVRIALAAGVVVAGWGMALSVPKVSAASGKSAAVASGEELYRKRACAMCHSLEPGKNLVGPSLAGIYGKPVGSVSGYTYSRGLAAMKGTWDEKRLDAWLANPSAVIPGTKMAIKVASPQERAAIIAYLKAKPVK